MVVIEQEIVDFDDARMGQVETFERLFFQLIHGHVVIADGFRGELEGHFAPEALILGQPDHPHATTT